MNWDKLFFIKIGDMMKNIIILNGAGRKNGNTASLIKAFKEGARDNSIQEFYLHDMNIKGCKGCLVCKNKGLPCVQKDDMYEIYDVFRDADIVVFASPSYFGNISGQLKTAGDRLYAMFNSLPEEDYKKESVLLMTAGAPYYENAMFWYRIYAHMGWVSLGEVLGAGKEAEAKALGEKIK